MQISYNRLKKVINTKEEKRKWPISEQVFIYVF